MAGRFRRSYPGGGGTEDKQARRERRTASPRSSLLSHGPTTVLRRSHGSPSHAPINQSPRPTTRTHETRKRDAGDNETERKRTRGQRTDAGRTTKRKRTAPQDDKQARDARQQDGGRDETQATRIKASKRDERGEAIGSVPSSSFISSSSHLLFRLVVFRRSSSHHLIRSSHPRRRLIRPAVVVPHRSVCRFRLLVAPCSCFPRSVVSRRGSSHHLIRHLIPAVVSSVVLPSRAPFRLLVARRSSPRLVHRSVVVPPLVPLSSRSIPSARPRSPFPRHGRRGVLLIR